MADFFTLGTEARYIAASPDAPRRVTNSGASTIGRKATSDVASTDNSLTTGQSYVAEAGFWYVSAASSKIVVEDYGTAATAGSYRSPDLVTCSGPPVSGTSRAFPSTAPDAGGLLLDNVNGNLYVNEGTKAAPYYTPASFDQPGLFSAYVANSVGAGSALAATTAEDYVGHGVRVFGHGKAENGDAGFIGSTGVEGAELNILHVTNETARPTCLGTQAGIYQPDTHGTFAVDVTFTDNADILTSSIFFGFVGVAASNCTDVATGATTTATLALDDLAGLYTDAGMTDANGGFLISEKSNLSGTHTGLTTVVDRAAAATYQRWRVEVDSSGYAIVFANRLEVGVIPGATGAGTHAATTSSLDADEEVSPIFQINNLTTTTRTATVKQFSTWGVLA